MEYPECPRCGAEAGDYPLDVSIEEGQIRMLVRHSHGECPVRRYGVVVGPDGPRQSFPLEHGLRFEEVAS